VIDRGGCQGGREAAAPAARVGVGGPPGGKASENRKCILGSSPEIWREMISGGDEVLEGKWGGLFLGYLLRKKFISRRGAAVV